MNARNPNLAEWLIPTLAQGMERDENGIRDEEGPDFFAVGFQEMIPLHLSLLGLTKLTLDNHDDQIKRVLETHVAKTAKKNLQAQRETYTLLSKKVLGGIVLLVYARDRTMTNKVVEVRVGSAACGIFGRMGNKGAVGCRVVIDENRVEGEELEEGEEEEDDEDDEDDGNDDESELSSITKRRRRKEVTRFEPTVFTFVTSHLAAHDHGLERRNRDWQSIVERLVFTQDELSTEFQPRKAYVGSKGKIEGEQVYDTSYLFYFGDLNYRISIKEPKALPLHVLSHKIINDLDDLLLHDSLRQQQNKGKTLHGLKEGPITFRPTYKYKPGTISEFKKFTKRVPGWTDRILFATWADGQAGAGYINKKVKKGRSSRRDEIGKEDNGGSGLVQKKRKGVKVELYRSIMEFTGSDHKPVTAIVSLPRQPKPSRKNPSTALRLVLPAPFTIDKHWRRAQLIGFLLDRFVGFFWSLFMLAGFGKNAGFGFANVTVTGLALWYYSELAMKFLPL